VDWPTWVDPEAQVDKYLQSRPLLSFPVFAFLVFQSLRKMSTEDVKSSDSSKHDSNEKDLGFDGITETHDVQHGVIIESGLRRGLLGRHVSLISLASVIGASCFYGFGYALALSGPLGALLGFAIVGKSAIIHFG
jgi:amino acid permease